MATNSATVFSPDIPPDIEHAAMVREEALDWLERNQSGVHEFTSGQVLRMAGEQERRWLVTRLRDKGIGDTELFNLPDTADALTVLYLRSRGVKFREAINAVTGDGVRTRSQEPRYGGVWNRLIDVGLKRLRQHLTARLLASVMSSLLTDPNQHPNSLVVVKRHADSPTNARGSSGSLSEVDHEHVYRVVLERPGPSCWVLSPFKEVLFLEADQLPTRSEIISRQFSKVFVSTPNENYELLVGTITGARLQADDETLQFVGRVLDIVYRDFEEFLEGLSSQTLETNTVPRPNSSDDLRLWLITQLLEVAYPGSLSEIIETSSATEYGEVLASSAVKPWEPALWDPPRTLGMLAGYTSRIGVPLVVDRLEEPWTGIIESVEPEIRFLERTNSSQTTPRRYSAATLPIFSSPGECIGAMYLLLPVIRREQLAIEIKVLTVVSSIVGEIIERQRAATHAADVSVNITHSKVLNQAEFRDALLDALERTSAELARTELYQDDLRLPFLLLSADSPNPDHMDPVDASKLKKWLIETLDHLEWRSFVRSHWNEVPEDLLGNSFIGELPGVGVLIALNKLVSKDDLDRLRANFPTTINRTVPSNSPVKFVAWVLDVPAQRIKNSSASGQLSALATQVEQWAVDVANVVDDVAQSHFLAHREGQWDAALRRVRQALRKESGRKNGYLYRLAAECSFSLGDWPGALKYARGGAMLSATELGSGMVRSQCQEADAHVCLVEPVRAWDLFTEATNTAPPHPLPRYFRGQSLILIARLLREYENELVRDGRADAAKIESIGDVVGRLVNGALDDLTSASDLLERWGLIPDTYQYRNFHLVPTLLGQGVGYLLNRSPGPAASRLQSAHRAFPKDDMFFREFLFAKCFEQGVHRQYGALLTSPDWQPFNDRLVETFGNI
jgi:hypothetical protein